MPCYEPSTDQMEIGELKAQVNKLTRMLCSTLEHSTGVTTKETMKWYKEHQEVDAERREQREKENMDMRLKISGLGKLTAAEKKALGL